jgi:hypothetical protein
MDEALDASRMAAGSSISEIRATIDRKYHL